MGNKDIRGGALWWDMVKFPKEKEWKLCMERAKAEGAQEEKAQAAVQESHLRKWGDMEGLLGKV